MSWWRFWQKDEPDHPNATAPTASPAAPQPDSFGTRRPEPTSDPARERRLTELRRRQEDARFDVERAELALAPDNPWTERIALLSETLASVDADRRAIDDLPPAPTFSLPPTPIRDLRASGNEPIEVSFAIGDQRFVFREETDWDQRGGPTVRGDLRPQAGDPAALLPSGVGPGPPETPPDRRDALATHLADSLFVFAADLRDRALSGEPLPTAPTLTDLATSCPICGGWQDWRGRCPECARRDLRRRSLRSEADRLEAERSAASEERHRWADRLPVARRRLAQIEVDIASVGG